jgi:hypothetical protein
MHSIAVIGVGPGIISCHFPRPLDHRADCRALESDTSCDFLLRQPRCT